MSGESKKISQPKVSWETYLSYSMFAENIKGCLTEILKHIFLINEKKLFKTFFFLKLLITIIKCGVSAENTRK